MPDAGLDVGVDGRDDLRSVLEIELVAVVRRRVVARCDHHSGGGIEVTDREGQHRCRLAAEQVDAKAGAGEAGSRLVGEVGGPVPGVASHDDAGLFCPGPLVPQPAGEGGGGGAHDGAVHPVRAGADRPPQAGRAEGEAAGEPVCQLSCGCRPGVVEQALQLGTGAGVRVLRQPRPGGGGGVAHVSGRGVAHGSRRMTAAMSDPTGPAARAPSAMTSSWLTAAPSGPAATFVTRDSPSTSAPS